MRPPRDLNTATGCWRHDAVKPPYEDEMDFAELEKNIKALWKWFIGGDVPQYVITTASVIAAVLVVLFLVAKVAKEIKPLFYDATERRRVRRRRRFAEHVGRQIDNIDNAADWTEHKYSELEAEVEAEGRRSRWFGINSQSTLRRERSLSRALRNSRERMILLEGDPGAGKSVALRHLAVVVAAAAKRSRSSKSVVPLYINLKTIDRAPGRSVDAALVREHVLKTLNNANIRDVEEFLNDEFARGLEEGTWLFLFDSFDEIPDILSATSAETSIRDYAQAIAAFLTSMNACRGVVASRYFRGPGALGWPRFRILALSDEYRRRLIRRADLPIHIERELIGRLELADPALAVTSRNPMLLGLLCQHMAKGNPFPDNTHVVFENYVDTRLRRDEDKLIRRYSVGSVQVREAAELAAFCMAYHPTLGLSPTRSALAAAMRGRGYNGEPSVMFDALEFIKLARPEGGSVDATFTFAHRRFQEYFATSVVLESPDIVTPERLLTDARWRETTVVLLQTQTGDRLATIVGEIERLLEREVAAIEADLPDASHWRSTGSEWATDESLPNQVREFPWPPLALHLLSLLQSGYQGRASVAPPRLRELVGRVVFLATATGTLADRKWALEVAGISPSPILTRAIREAFMSHSRWLSEVAYRQAALLGNVPEDIGRAIRRELLQMFARGRLRQEREATLAHIQRLPHSEQFIRSARLLLKVAAIDICLHAVCLGVLVGKAERALPAVAVVIAITLSAAGPYVLARLWVRGGAAVFDPMDFAFTVIWTRGPMLAIVKLIMPGVGNEVLLWVVGLWSISAIAAAAAGEFTAVGWWPFLSAFLVLSGIRNIRSVIVRVRQRLVPLFSIAIVGLLSFVLMDILSVDAKVVVLAIMGCALVVLATIWLSQWSTRRLADYRLVRRHLRSAQRFTNANDLVGILHQFRTETQQARFIELVVQRSMVEPTVENETLLRKVAVDFENEKLLDRQPGISQSDQRNIRLNRASIVGDEASGGRVIDGLNILAEQLRTRRALE
jgi:hypothetical protein